MNNTINRRRKEMLDNLRINELLDLEHTVAADIFSGLTYPWEALPRISEFIIALGKTLSPDEYDLIGDDIWVAKTARVAQTAYLHGPLIICPGAEVRHCAFIRGSAIIGSGSVIGNSSELKNCIIFDNAQVPHYNYIGDSILGYRSHLGAGAKTSNLKSDKTNISVRAEDEIIDTEMKKFGAIVGDFVEVGVIGRNTTIYPLSMVRGYVTHDSIYKKQGEIAEKL